MPRSSHKQCYIQDTTILDKLCLCVVDDVEKRGHTYALIIFAKALEAKGGRGIGHHLWIFYLSPFLGRK